MSPKQRRRLEVLAVHRLEVLEDTKHTSAQNRTHLFLAGHAGAQAGAKIADRGRKGLVIAKGVHLPAKGKKRAWRACGGLTGGKE